MNLPYILTYHSVDDIGPHCHSFDYEMVELNISLSCCCWGLSDDPPTPQFSFLEGHISLLFSDSDA